MRWIIGLGNPGDEYATTRHNVGFMVVDALAARMQIKFDDMQKHQAAVARSAEATLIKPLTYMNTSGTAVRSVMQFYDKELLQQSRLDSVFVVHDDLDMPLGKWKCELGHGPKAHNGLTSLYEQLGSQAFWHVRVGIDARDRSTPEGQIPGRAYVLQAFSDSELSLLEPTISAILDRLTIASA